MYEDRTRYQDDGAVFSCIVRIGIVTAVDNEKRLAQVQFQDMNLPSGWIPVLINRDVIHYYPYDVPQWTEFETEWKPDRVGDKDYVDHRHKHTEKLQVVRVRPVRCPQPAQLPRPDRVHGDGPG